MQNTKANVLLIEDEEDFAFTLKERLLGSKDLACTVEIASSLEVGLARISKGGIDAITLDLNIKDSTGLDTLKKVHAAAEHLPIVVLTGEYDHSKGPEILQLGAQDYFVKGQIEPMALARAVRYAIERKALEKAQESSLKKAYSEIKFLLGLVPSIMVRVDLDETIRYWNECSERLLGVDYRTAVDKPLSECPVEWDYGLIHKGIVDCHEKKKRLYLKDIKFKRPDGSDGVLGITVNPIETISDQYTGTVIFGADLTEQRRLETELGRK